MITEQLAVSVPEAGRMLGVSRTTAWALARDKRLPVIRLGRRTVVPTSAIRKLLEGAA